jgi:hypothetical protein
LFWRLAALVKAMDSFRNHLEDSMEKFDSMLKIADVAIKFIALIFPIVLFRKQMSLFQN